jgi:hypothetical protein
MQRLRLSQHFADVQVWVERVPGVAPRSRPVPEETEREKHKREQRQRRTAEWCARCNAETAARKLSDAVRASGRADDARAAGPQA